MHSSHVARQCIIIERMGIGAPVGSFRRVALAGISEWRLYRSLSFGLSENLLGRPGRHAGRDAGTGFKQLYLSG
jgi:hypothetical protein